MNLTPDQLAVFWRLAWQVPAAVCGIFLASLLFGMLLGRWMRYVDDKEQALLSAQRAQRFSERVEADVLRQAQADQARRVHHGLNGRKLSDPFLAKEREER